MSVPELLAIAVGLGADAFSVSVGVGACWHDLPSRVRASAGFGVAQFVMPVVGWTVGGLILPYIETYDHWVTFGVLAAIAAKMLYESYRAPRDDHSCARTNPTRGLLLLGLSLAVSIDALAVGFTMGSLDSRRWAYAGVIGVVAAAMTWLGFTIAREGAERLGVWAARAGALLVLAVAVQMLLA